MYVLVVQQNRAFAAFATSTQGLSLSNVDIAIADAFAVTADGMEAGYFDVLLLPDVTLKQFKDWTSSVAPLAYECAVDHIIRIR